MTYAKYSPNALAEAIPDDEARIIPLAPSNAAMELEYNARLTALAETALSRDFLYYAKTKKIS